MNTEHVDIGLARFSDWAFTSSVVVLVAAMVLLAVELAYSRGRKVESAELVGATVGADSATPGVVAAEPKRPLDERVGKAGHTYQVEEIDPLDSAAGVERRL